MDFIEFGFSKLRNLETGYLAIPEHCTICLVQSVYLVVLLFPYVKKLHLKLLFATWNGRLQSHFESIQRISDSTTLPSVLPHLKARLFELVNLSGLTEKLMTGKEDPQALSSKEKLQLWQELKVLSKHDLPQIL